MEWRTQKEIEQALEEAEAKVWYDRNAMLESKRDVPHPDATKAAKEIEEKYGEENVGPYTDFEWGELCGKLSTLRWLMGNEWGNLDS